MPSRSQSDLPAARSLRSYTSRANAANRFRSLPVLFPHGSAARASLAATAVPCANGLPSGSASCALLPILVQVPVAVWKAVLSPRTVLRAAAPVPDSVSPASLPRRRSRFAVVSKLFHAVRAQHALPLGAPPAPPLQSIARYVPLVPPVPRPAHRVRSVPTRAVPRAPSPNARSPPLLPHERPRRLRAGFSESKRVAPHRPLPDAAWSVRSGRPSIPTPAGLVRFASSDVCAWH